MKPRPPASAPPTRVRRAQVGEVYLFELSGGRWGACQVVRDHGDEVEIVSLDRSWDRRPTLTQAKRARGLERFGALDRCRVDAFPRWPAELLGSAPLVAKVPDDCRTWGGWRTGVDYARSHPDTDQVREARDSQLSLDAAGLKKLLLPERVQSLTLRGRLAPGLRVEAADAGRGLALTLVNAGTVDVRGLQRLRSLRMWDSGVDLARLATRFPALECLRIYGDFATLERVGALRKLKDLRELEVHDAYTFDADELPRVDQLPLLQRVELRGFPAAAQALIEERLGTGPLLLLRSARAAGWVEENRTNPFREWSDADAALGKAATQAWKKARAAAKKAGARASQKAAKRVLEPFVAALNARAVRIDTIRREEACDAYFLLATELGISEELGQDWLDEWREF